jgi:hypothetical protein
LLDTADHIEKGLTHFVRHNGNGAGGRTGEPAGVFDTARHSARGDVSTPPMPMPMPTSGRWCDFRKRAKFVRLNEISICSGDPHIFGFAVVEKLRRDPL